MVTYTVGDEEHKVDHPPIFACREHKALLRLSADFVAELLQAARDVMPGNPEEIASSYLKEAASAYRLPEFLVPPKVVLFNPDGLRGADGLPYALVLVGKYFFGIPARYLTPGRFDGCDVCRELSSARLEAVPDDAVVAAAPPPRAAPGLAESGLRSSRAPGGAPPGAGKGPRPPGPPQAGGPAQQRPPSGVTRAPGVPGAPPGSSAPKKAAPGGGGAAASPWGPSDSGVRSSPAAKPGGGAGAPPRPKGPPPAKG